MVRIVGTVVLIAREMSRAARNELGGAGQPMKSHQVRKRVYL